MLDSEKINQFHKMNATILHSGVIADSTNYISSLYLTDLSVCKKVHRNKSLILIAYKIFVIKTTHSPGSFLVEYV